ncbi:alpha/beta fold hydrolase [Pseudooceanicola sp. GBMRC 2024]|uniref:Alpha/beta fold hydrolase n=1 Tax=Pseudooceanicola albus TaxID=2692189 RepID=A0A6L7G387_9RHOB|nr:alpha/beta fold hydrolase [Pseudooceanicola albus]MXN17937.1 alpha/beta fold hydrolase [Pseudooceanicola albus]
MPFHIAEDGCRIHHDRFGSAGPLVLLLPGLGGDARFWTGTAQGLSGRFRVIATDHRGAGRSDRPEGAYTLERIARDVAGLITAQGEPVHLVGHSTGGAVAQMLGIDPPPGLASLVLSCTWARSDARFRALFEARAAILEAGLTEAYQALSDVFGHMPADLATREDAFLAGRAAAAQKLQPLAVTAARIRMLLAHDCLDAVPAIRLPTLVLPAAGDILLPPEMSAPIAAAIPGARLTCLPGGHFHPAADPAPLVAALQDFLSEVA